VVFWQLQETTRTALIARSELSRVVIGDAVAYLGRIGVLLLLEATGALSIRHVFAAIAAASLTGTIIQTAQLGVTRISFAGFRAYTTESWKLSSWWFLGRMSGVLTLQIFTWVLAVREGPVGAAKYQALITTLAAVNPLLSSLGNIVPPGVSALLSRSGSMTAIRSGVQSSMILVLPIYAYLVGVSCFPHLILRGFYGTASSYLPLAGTLRVLAIAFACDAIAGSSLAILGGLKQTRPVFASQFIGTLMALVVGGPLTLRWGLTAAAFSLIAVNAVRAVAGALFIYRVRNSTERRSIQCDAGPTAALSYTGEAS
jgi:O-antigen/teichoic acid export membrane protein